MQTQRPELWSAFADRHRVPGGSGAAFTARWPTESNVHVTQVVLCIAVQVIGTDEPPTLVCPVP